MVAALSRFKSASGIVHEACAEVKINGTTSPTDLRQESAFYGFKFLTVGESSLEQSGTTSAHSTHDEIVTLTDVAVKEIYIIGTNVNNTAVGMKVNKSIDFYNQSPESGAYQKTESSPISTHIESIQIASLVNAVTMAIEVIAPWMAKTAHAVNMGAMQATAVVQMMINDLVMDIMPETNEVMAISIRIRSNQSNDTLRAREEVGTESPIGTERGHEVPSLGTTTAG